MPSAITKVLVYDSSNLQCELLSAGLNSLQKGLEVNCVCDLDAITALLTADAQWVVIISDTALNGEPPLFAKFLHTHFPGIPLIFIVQQGCNDYVVEAFRLGARGIVYSNEGLTQLAKCIECVSEGELWVRPADLAMIFEKLSKPGGRMTDVSGNTLLSPREEEISGLVAEGMSNREVSQALQITESTVKNSLFHVFDKLGISNRVELARYVNSATERKGFQKRPGSIGILDPLSHPATTERWKMRRRHKLPDTVQSSNKFIRVESLRALKLG
jgi:DNA-binding NarL/FixJ family response regulator